MYHSIVHSLVLRPNRRAIALRGALVLLAAAGVWATVSTPPAESRQVANLRERLKFGLLAKIPSELEFIDRVVFLVDTGKLPERLVNQTFFWARDRASAPRAGRPRRPIIYFQPAMTDVAERIGVDIGVPFTD
jgi:hypothetical protein